MLASLFWKRGWDNVPPNTATWTNGPRRVDSGQHKAARAILVSQLAFSGVTTSKLNRKGAVPVQEANTNACCELVLASAQC